MSRYRPNVEIYTDGACSVNPGEGGYGAILVLKRSDGSEKRKEISEKFRLTTNNRMELMGVIFALAELGNPCNVDIHSDSKYVTDAFNKDWITNWKKKGWKKSGGGLVKNVDLWKTLDKVLESHSFSFHWVKGHSDNEFNNRCDELAVGAHQDKDRKSQIDKGFEEGSI
jgi:ribonuclease HI